MYSGILSVAIKIRVCKSKNHVLYISLLPTVNLHHFPWEANLSNTLKPSLFPRHNHACHTRVLKFERSQLESSLEPALIYYLWLDQLLQESVLYYFNCADRDVGFVPIP